MSELMQIQENLLQRGGDLDKKVQAYENKVVEGQTKSTEVESLKLRINDLTAIIQVHEQQKEWLEDLSFIDHWC